LVDGRGLLDDPLPEADLAGLTRADLADERRLSEGPRITFTDPDLTV